VAIAWELLYGAAWDLFRVPYVVDVVVNDLHYPTYLLTIIGAWKLAGGIVLLLPRLPRLKEWAYAGAFFNYTGAIFSYSAIAEAGDGIAQSIGARGFALILMVSWALRPPSRRTLSPA
jgi:uncharacterized membrane protein YphA (DoxX/SURF4 family)